MIPVSLTTERIELADGGTAYPYPWHGETVAVLDNAATVLRVVDLLFDEEKPESDKAAEAIPLVFADPDAAYTACDYDDAEFGRLVESVVWDIFGVDLAGRASDKPLWDVEEDAAAIRTSLRMAYGIEWDTLRSRIPWGEFVALVSGLPYDTPLGCAMHYRDERNRPKQGKHNRKQVEEFDRLHRLFALKGKPKTKGSHGNVETANRAMDDLALAAMRKAR